MPPRLPHASLSNNTSSGFTLVEVAIILVIIGLIVGGVIAGLELINAAAARGQISQISRYRNAADTFRARYSCLPGDCKNAYSYGFIARGTLAGQGDGNGVIEGYGTGLGLCPGNHSGYMQATGETGVFWVDLTAAGLIEGSFTAATSTTPPASNLVGATINNYFPQAKIGGGNFVTLWSGGTIINGAVCSSTNRNNYFSISLIEHVAEPSGIVYGSAGISISEAYNIDQKMDDGFPQSGAVQALYLNFNTPDQGSIAWAASDGNFGARTGAPNFGPTTAATPMSATTCYDNNNTAGTRQAYSMSQDNGKPINCAISFRF